jgi:hypothetical protein
LIRRVCSATARQLGVWRPWNQQSISNSAMLAMGTSAAGKSLAAANSFSVHQ